MYNLNDVRRAMGDLMQSTQDSIESVVLLGPTPSLAGAFAVPRTVSCYIDFLGALYCGWDGKNRQKIATSKKAETFIEEILGLTDLNYKKHGQLFYRMLRHGTVHLLRPHKFKRQDGSTLEWVIYWGERKKSHISYGGRELVVDHLEPLTLDQQNKRDIFPVSIECLYKDIREAITLYLDKLEEEGKMDKHDLLDKYESTIQALMEPETTNLIW